nr:MAG TPA: hypothetical protein [Caudoviricetes sp.]
MVSYYDSFYCQLNTLGVEYSVGNMKCSVMSCFVI